MNHSRAPPPYGGKFTIGLLGKGLQKVIEDILLDGDIHNVLTSDSTTMQENSSYRVISAHHLFNEEYQHPDQQIIDFMALSYPGPHLFILAVDQEDTQEETVLAQISKLQETFGETITKQLVIFMLDYRTCNSLKHLKESDFHLEVISGNLVNDCKKWCTGRQSFIYDYKKYGQDVVSKRRAALQKRRNTEHQNHQREVTDDDPTTTRTIVPIPEKAAHRCHTADEGPKLTDSLMNIVLLGLTGTGKSASANTILSAGTIFFPNQLFRSESNSLPVTTTCEVRLMGLFGAQVRVVDTPDFLHDRLQNHEALIKECKQYCQPERCLVLLVIQLGRFTDQEIGILEKLEDMFGWRIRDNTIVLMTHGEELKGNLDQFIQMRPPLWRIVQMCSNRCHLFSNLSKDTRQVKQLMGKFTQFEKLFPQLKKHTEQKGCPVS